MGTHLKPQGDELSKPGSRVRDGLMTGPSDSETALHDEAKQFLTPIWVIFGLSMGPAIALGLGRFTYALLLPSMRADLRWSFADSGAMNTANAAGYLIGALVAAHIGRRVSLTIICCDTGNAIKAPAFPICTPATRLSHQRRDQRKYST